MGRPLVSTMACVDHAQADRSALHGRRNDASAWPELADAGTHPPTRARTHTRARARVRFHLSLRMQWRSQQPQNVTNFVFGGLEHQAMVSDPLVVDTLAEIIRSLG